MQSIRELARRVRMLVRRDRFDRDLEREMRLHLEMQAEENRDAGMTERDAIDAARRRFGNTTLLREASRDVWGWASLERLVQDVRHAARSLGRDRLFTSVAILVLALGIGGNATVFSLVNGLILNPFPYPHADRLVEILSQRKSDTAFATVHLPDFAFWRDQGTSFDAMGTYGWVRSSLTGQSVPGFEGPERILTGTATEAFLRVLGVQPALGRFFTTDEDRPGGSPVAVLSYGAWIRRFGGRRDVLGQTLTLDGTIRTIIGVMPARLALPGMFTCEVWVPAAYDVAVHMQPDSRYDTQYMGDHVVARLKPGVALARAQTELTLICQRIWQQRPAHPQWKGIAVPLGSDMPASEENRLQLLALIVGTGLLLACANLAGLLLARSAARAKEVAVHAALGAGRSRLVRYALTEAVALAVCGGALGLALAAWGIGVIGRAAPPFMGLDSALRIDRPVLAFALGLSLLTGLVFGLVPALHGSKADVTTVLKGTSAGGRGRKRGRILSGLVVVEVSLALLLLLGGALMARTFIALTRVDTGVRPDGVLTFRVSLAGTTYDAKERRARLFADLLERLRLIPGVTGAGAVDPLPMSREYSGGGFTIEGRPPVTWRDMHTQYCDAMPQYFRTIGIPVLLGREFEAADSTGSVVLINNALAKRFFAGENPLGQRITDYGTIVGVVGDVRHNGPAREADAQIYSSAAAQPARTMSIVVRTSGDPLKLAPLVRQQVRALDRDLPIDRLKPMNDVISESIADVRLITALIGGFAIFALALAAIGMYGVIAYSVSQRQHEIGIRIALGASPGHVLALVLARAALLALAGIVIGVPVALAAVRLLASFLYGVSPRDAGIFVTVPLLLLAVTLLASYLPARHATKIDPLDALRAE